MRWGQSILVRRNGLVKLCKHAAEVTLLLERVSLEYSGKSKRLRYSTSAFVKYCGIVYVQSCWYVTNDDSRCGEHMHMVYAHGLCMQFVHMAYAWLVNHSVCACQEHYSRKAKQIAQGECTQWKCILCTTSKDRSTGESMWTRLGDGKDTEQLEFCD